VTFSLPAPKTFHHQGRFLIRIIIFVKSVRRKRSFQLPLFGQAVLSSYDLQERNGRIKQQRGARILECLLWQWRQALGFAFSF